MIEKITTLIEKNIIEEKIKELAKQIEKDYEGKDIFFVCILKGGVIFMVDLARHISKNVFINFMDVSSYGTLTDNNNSDLKILMDLDEPISGEHVIIIEDIVDSGRTLNMLRELLLSRNPASIKICTLLDKHDRRVVDVSIDYTGFQIPDEFVVGYGLDYAQKYRNLDYIGVISFEEE